MVAGLLVAGLLGPVSGAVATAGPRAQTATLVVPASDFFPTSDDWSYRSVGYLMGSGYGSYAAPVDFPMAEVKIKKITLYAFDMDPFDICLSLYRSAPAAMAPVSAGMVCTSGTSTTNPQVLPTTDLDPRSVNAAFHGSYLLVNFSGGTGDYTLKFYGAKVTYTYEP